MTIDLVVHGTPLYEATKRLRDEVLRRPLGLKLTANDVKGEEQHIHIAASEQPEVVGTVVLKPTSEFAVTLRQMAVRPTQQGTGLGRALVQFAEQVARSRGFTEIEMHARVSARGFYEKLGYRATGDVFIEVTVPHVRMSKHLGE